MKKPRLTRKRLLQGAKAFSPICSRTAFPEIYGITDGKAAGTFIEHRFREYLEENYEFRSGSSARGIDFPELETDIKVTSIKQPQSSCPYRSARQKIYGLGYSLPVFVYEKIDDHKKQDRSPEFSAQNFWELHTQIKNV